MKSILEKALVHLLNEENEKAEELLHQYVIEQARSIHESLREGDDMGDDEELDEEYFSEADLVDAERDHAAEELGDDLGEEPEDAEAMDVADDTLDADMAADDADMAADDADMAADDADMDGDTDVDAEIENFEQQLADLQAQFDDMLANIEGDNADDVADDDMDADADMADADADMADADADMEAADVDMADAGDEDEDAFAHMHESEEFEDITESVVDELQKVAAETAEGKTTNGADVGVNKQSLKFTRPMAKAPTSTNRVGHTGYARETAPTSVPEKGGKTVVSTKMRNVRDKATSGNTPFTKEDKAALLNKRAAPNDKSPIAGNTGGEMKTAKKVVGKPMYKGTPKVAAPTGVKQPVQPKK